MKTSNIPTWASEIISSYESAAAGCFVLHGNINDRLLIPDSSSTAGAVLGGLQDFILESLLPRFDVILSYDPGQGLRVERGGEVFSKWPSVKDGLDLPDAPLAAVRVVTHYFKYCKNLQAVGAESPKVAVVIRQAHLICPSLPNSHNHELNAMASILRSWAAEMRLQEHGQAAFLISENINGLHPLVARSPRVCAVEVPLPTVDEMEKALELLYDRCPTALVEFSKDFSRPASRLAGSTLSSVEVLLLRREHAQLPLDDRDLSDLKRALVERDCGGLIDFIEPDRDFDGVVGLDGVKSWLRQDIALWKQDRLEAMPMGYLFCGPVGTGKTYLVECLAGEAGVPVVTLKNFRDRWVGSTEENLEKIFSLLHALGRCIVFIDEADQALGRRESGSGDSGVGSRVYSMMAKEMSDTRNRGKILWVLASSRPDLIEVDLKRPGRIDVKIPLFPCANVDEGWVLLRALCKHRGVILGNDAADDVRDGVPLRQLVPALLTPGAAESVAVKAHRLMITEGYSAALSLRKCLEGYLPPVSPVVIQSQIQLAVDEASDISFIPNSFRSSD